MIVALVERLDAEDSKLESKDILDVLSVVPASFGVSLAAMTAVGQTAGERNCIHCIHCEY